MRQLFIQVTIYKSTPLNLRSKYCLQHGVLAHNEQQGIKAPIRTSVLRFKREKQQFNLYKKLETRNTFEPRQQTTTIMKIRFY